MYKYLLPLQLILLQAFVLSTTFAQKKTALSIGNSLPNIELRNIQNYHKKNLFINELNEKAILFDFGTTSCPPCIQALKELDSLQKLFIKDIQIFMVTPEKTETVTAFLKNNKIAADISIPIITEDTLLSKYFRHRSIPHEVWVDKNKIIKAFTDHHYITGANVDSLIKGFKLSWPIKWDFAYDYKQPLVVLNTNQLNPESYPDKILHSSFFAKSMSGIKAGYSELVDTVNNTVRTKMINQSIVEMYLRLYNRIWDFVFPPSQVLLNVRDPNHIFYDPSFGYKALWKKNNTYCYEAIFPLSLSKENRDKRMIQELNYYLKLNVSLEKREMTCWVLKLLNNSATIVSKANQNDRDGDTLFSIDRLVYTLNHTYQLPPLIDETSLSRKLKSKFSIPITSGSMKDYETLNRQLAPYGLMIQEAKREIEVCIITDQQL